MSNLEHDPRLKDPVEPKPPKGADIEKSSLPKSDNDVVKPQPPKES